MKTLPEWNESELRVRLSRAGMPVLVGLCISTCESCTIVAGMLEELAGEFAGRATIARLSQAGTRKLARTLGIESLPTVALFRGLTLVDQREGVWPLWAYREMLQYALTAQAV